MSSIRIAPLLEPHRYADEPADREAIRDRKVYGAFVATPDARQGLISLGNPFSAVGSAPELLPEPVGVSGS